MEEIYYKNQSVVPTQNAFFHKIRLPELLRDYGGVVLGISAGSMNMAATV